MPWTDTFWSDADRLLRGWVPTETDVTYQCVLWALALALLPAAAAHAVGYAHRLRRWRHAPAAPGGGRGRGEREEEEEQQRRLARGAQATERALTGLGLFAAGVAALQVERVRPLDANTHCLAGLAYRALHALWGLNHTLAWSSPATAASPLGRWLAGPACGVVLAGLATFQVVVMFYEAAARRRRSDAGTRNIWFATF